MKVIIIGDIHGRNSWKTLRDKADKLVFVGDYFDTREKINGKKQLDNFVDLISFKRENPDKVILLLGNHDYQYLRGVDETYSGYQPHYHHDIREALEYALTNKMIDICYFFNNNKEKFLVSHAGVSQVWFDINAKDKEGSSVVEKINNLFLKNRDNFSFYQKGMNNRNPYGDNVEQSPIWIREASLLSSLLRGGEISDYKQIIGHTMVDKIIIDEYPNFIKVDSLHNKEYLIVNDDNIEIGKIGE